MLCAADCNKAKAQRLEWLQVRLMRRCNEKCRRPGRAFCKSIIQSMEGSNGHENHAPRVGLQQAKSSARRRVAEVPVMTAHQAQISPKNLTRSFGSDSAAKACPPNSRPTVDHVERMAITLMVSSAKLGMNVPT